MNRKVSRLPNSPDPLTTPARAAAGAVGHARRTLAVAVVEFRVADEGARTRLIGDISCLLREPAIPESARSAGLELIGFLARRMPGETAHALGVDEALEAKRTLGRKAR